MPREVEAKIEERPTSNAEAFELYTRGRHLWTRGARPDVERAIELFGRARETLNRVLELSPSNAQAHAELGQLYDYLGYEYRALKEIELARELDPLAPDVGAGLVDALRSVGRDREAVERAAAVLELHPDFEPAADQMANALVDVGRGAEAIETLRQKLRRDPRSIFTNEGLAWTLLQTGQADAALDQIIRAAELTPDDFPTQGSLAFMLLGARRFDEAVAAARRHVQLAPENPSARGQLADALLAVGDTAAAVAHLDSAAVMDPQFGPLVVEAMFRAGLVDEAVGWSARLAEEEEESVNRRRAYARFLFETSPWAAHTAEDALAVFDQALKMSAREDHVLWAYGQTLHELGRTSESLAPFQTVVSDQPGSADAHNLLGWELLIGQRDPTAAGREFRRALGLNSAEANAHWGLARVHARAGMAPGARGHACRARRHRSRLRDADPRLRAPLDEAARTEQRAPVRSPAGRYTIRRVEAEDGACGACLPYDPLRRNVERFRPASLARMSRSEVPARE